MKAEQEVSASCVIFQALVEVHTGHWQGVASLLIHYSHEL